MQNIEKIGVSKDVWVRCPACKQLYYISREFYEPKFNHLKLHCPFCHFEFAKEETQVWGA